MSRGPSGGRTRRVCCFLASELELRSPAPRKRLCSTNSTGRGEGKSCSLKDRSPLGRSLSLLAAARAGSYIRLLSPPLARRCLMPVHCQISINTRSFAKVIDASGRSTKRLKTPINRRGQGKMGLDGAVSPSVNSVALQQQRTTTFSGSTLGFSLSVPFLGVSRSLKFLVLKLRHPLLRRDYSNFCLHETHGKKGEAAVVTERPRATSSRSFCRLFHRLPAGKRTGRGKGGRVIGLGLGRQHAAALEADFHLFRSLVPSLSMYVHLLCPCHPHLFSYPASVPALRPPNRVLYA